MFYFFFNIFNIIHLSHLKQIELNTSKVKQGEETEVKLSRKITIYQLIEQFIHFGKKLNIKLKQLNYSKVK